MKNGKCPSHLGITYEFQKMWLPKRTKDKKQHKENKQKKRTIKISRMLKTIYEDICRVAWDGR